MNRSEIWMAQVGQNTRPVLILTRSEVMDVRRLVTVAEITTSVRGLPVEVNLDQDETGLHESSAVNCDGIHTVPQRSLTTYVGTISDTTMTRVCWAINYALDC